MFIKPHTCAALFFFLVLVLMGSGSASAQKAGLWQKIDDSALARQPITKIPTPDNFATYRLDKLVLTKLLKSAPEEFTLASEDSVIELPMPGGTLERFRFEHSLVVERGLLVKFPELALTFRGYGIDNPTSTVRFDLLPNGFHAMVLSTEGTILIDPYAIGETDNYVTYNKGELPSQGAFKCEVSDKTLASYLSSIPEDQVAFVTGTAPEAPSLSNGTQLRTYRLALAADAEYCTKVGGNTVAGCLAAQVAIMNRVNGVYERDVAIHMNIVANNDLIVYAADNTDCSGGSCNSGNDPYNNTNPNQLLTQNQSNLDTVIGSTNYDIGHVFTTGGGGLAAINVSCQAGGKAQAETGLANPVGDAFAIDYVAHEMGHQWGGNHTFNGTVSSCSGGTRASSAAYEPGSGVSIMAYAGICGNQNLAAHSIDTFHMKSLQEISTYSQSGAGNVCAVTTSTGNTPPVVTIVGGPVFTIPKLTPFTLTATATDVNNDSLTYDWQEFDLGSSTTSVPNSDLTGAIPIFRSYSPSASGSRTFPSLQYILNNSNVPPSTFSCGGTCLTGELLPQISRTMSFQVVVRDNRALGGGLNTSAATVNVDGTVGPLAVTAPNTAVTYNGLSTQTVTWNVANTTNAPVSAANVKISFSSDGGNTFPTVLLASTANDGTETVTIPNVGTTQGRIKVEAVGNIFFDVSDTNFTVTAVTAVTHNVSDFDGDGKSDISVWRPSDGNWYYIKSSDSTVSAFHFGTSGDVIVPGDYDGDGKTDFAVYRSGIWYISASTAGFSGTQFGLATDLPVQGDFDGDGKTDIAVFRPSNGTWYVLASTAGFSGTQFGTIGDKPVVGDYDGDGKADIAVYRPSDGNWYQLRSTAGFASVHFGISTDKVVPGDYDGDGKTDVAVYRDGSPGNWFLLESTAGFVPVPFGTTGDIPVPGDFDGDGKVDTSVYRPTGGNWYLQRSTSGFAAQQFGVSTDNPTPASYVPNQ